MKKKKLLAGFLAIMLFSLLGLSRFEGFHSSEVAFTDGSQSGLSIVPASCNSYPHVASECDPPATCSIWLDSSSVDQPNGTYLRWQSSWGIYSTYITNIGYVGSSGAVWVAPSDDTTYSCMASGYNGVDGWHSVTLLVNRYCTAPWGSTVYHGNSVTAYQSSSVAYGSSCNAEGRICSDGSLSGSYQYSSCTVQPPANCSFNGQTVNHGSSVTAYQAANVAYGSSCISESRSCNNGALSGSYAYSSCTVQAPKNCVLDNVAITHGSSRVFYSVQTAPSGQVCSSYSQNRNCNNGNLSGSDAYRYANCSCAQFTSYTCAGTGNNTVRRTQVDSNCTTTTIDGPTCSSPAFCSAGSSVCLFPPPSFNATGQRSGHLEVIPSLIPIGATVQVHWNVSNVTSCTVSGSNGDAFDASCGGNSCFSSSNGRTSSAIQQTTTYTLNCQTLNGTTMIERDTARVVPIFQEK